MTDRVTVNIAVVLIASALSFFPLAVGAHGSTSLADAQAAIDANLRTPDKAGAVDEILLHPETPIGICARSAILGSRFTAPPRDGYWVGVYLKFREVSCSSPIRSRRQLLRYPSGVSKYDGCWAPVGGYSSS